MKTHKPKLSEYSKSRKGKIYSINIKKEDLDSTDYLYLLKKNKLKILKKKKKKNPDSTVYLYNLRDYKKNKLKTNLAEKKRLKPRWKMFNNLERVIKMYRPLSSLTKNKIKDQITKIKNESGSILEK